MRAKTIMPFTGRSDNAELPPAAYQQVATIFGSAPQSKVPPMVAIGSNVAVNAPRLFGSAGSTASILATITLKWSRDQDDSNSPLNVPRPPKAVVLIKPRRHIM